MEKRPHKGNRVLRAVKVGALWLLALLALNRIIYASILPIIFFHAGFDEDSYAQNETDDTLSPLAIESPGGTLYGWTMGHGDVIALYFGGDSMDSNKWLFNLDEQERARTFAEATLLTVDYPAFGRSEGVINEKSFYESAESLYAYAEKTYPSAKKMLIGYSLGCAAALYLASRYEADGLVLIAPMYDGTTMYFPRESFLHDWFAPTASVKLDNDAFAEDVAEKTLVIASTGDGMTRLTDIEALAARFPSAPEVLVLEGTGHGDYWDDEKTQQAIGAFLRDAA